MDWFHPDPAPRVDNTDPINCQTRGLVGAVKRGGGAELGYMGSGIQIYVWLLSVMIEP